MCLIPFIHFFIKSDLPSDINLMCIYILNLFATVLSYWLFAYKASLFQAYQRVDVISKINLVVKTFQYAIQFIILCLFRNYYAYLIVSLFSQIMINVVTSVFANKYYPQYKAVGSLELQEKNTINKRIKDLFVTKIGAVIVNSADTIVISSFLGLSVLGIYQNYYYIMAAVIGLIAVLFNACSAGIGNSLIVEKKEKNYEDLKKLTFIVQTISVNAVCLLLNLYQPFIAMWVGKEFLVAMPLVVCFCVYFYIYEINQLLNTYKDSAGIWEKDKIRIWFTGFTNVFLNLLLVNYIGLYGIILSTIISILVVGMPWLIRNLFMDVFERTSKEYVSNLIKRFLTTVLICVISYICCSMIMLDNILTIILRGIITLVIVNFLWLSMYKNIDEMNQMKSLLKFVLENKKGRKGD